MNDAGRALLERHVERLEHERGAQSVAVAQLTTPPGDSSGIRT
jgi:hypothetical protein